MGNASGGQGSNDSRRKKVLQNEGGKQKFMFDWDPKEDTSADRGQIVPIMRLSKKAEKFGDE